MRSFTAPGHVLDRHIGVNPVLVQQVDAVGLQPLQRSVHGTSDVVGMAIEAQPLARVRFKVEPEFRRDDHLLSHWRERGSDEFFVDEWTIRFGGVEEGHTQIDRGADKGDPRLAFGGWSEVGAEAHAAETESRHL